MPAWSHSGHVQCAYESVPQLLQGRVSVWEAKVLRTANCPVNYVGTIKINTVALVARVAF